MENEVVGRRISPVHLMQSTETFSAQLWGQRYVGLDTEGILAAEGDWISSVSLSSGVVCLCLQS